VAKSPITPREKDFAAWYQDVILQGDMPSCDLPAICPNGREPAVRCTAHRSGLCEHRAGEQSLDPLTFGCTIPIWRLTFRASYPVCFFAIILAPRAPKFKAAYRARGVFLANAFWDNIGWPNKIFASLKIRYRSPNIDLIQSKGGKSKTAKRKGNRKKGCTYFIAYRLA